MRMKRGPRSPWVDAINKAVHEYHEETAQDGKVKKIRYLNVLASKLVQKGIAGDVRAIREIGDRLDGKPKQTIAGDPEAPTTVIVTTGIVRDGDA